MKKILVIAPRFPAINQPWIDTYLEQLLANHIEPLIYSANREKGPYQQKVDRLQLRKYVVELSLDRLDFIKGILVHLIYSPIKFSGSLASAIKLRREFSEVEGSGIQTFLKLLYFSCSLKKFDGISLIHAHEEIAGYEFLHLARLLRIPVVVTFHGLPPKDVGQLSDKKRKLLYEYADVVLVNTEFSRNQILGLGCPPEKIVILPQGLPLEDFPFRADIDHRENDVMRLLTVGRFHRDKGQGYALLALARLKKMGLSPQWHFVGIGPDKSRLERLVLRLGLADSVVLHEALDSDRLLALYQSCDIFVLPSVDNGYGEHVETQGVVLQEAQACGCVPIASIVGGIPECLHHNNDAILVRQKSSRAIAKAVASLASDNLMRRSFQLNGRKNVEDNFSAVVIGRKMAKVLSKVARDRRESE